MSIKRQTVQLLILYSNWWPCFYTMVISLSYWPQSLFV